VNFLKYKSKSGIDRMGIGDAVSLAGKKL